MIRLSVEPQENGCGWHLTLWCTTNIIKTSLVLNDIILSRLILDNDNGYAEHLFGQWVRDFVLAADTTEEAVWRLLQDGLTGRGAESTAKVRLARKQAEKYRRARLLAEKVLAEKEKAALPVARLVRRSGLWRWLLDSCRVMR